MKIDKTTTAFIALAVVSGGACLTLRGIEPFWEAMVVSGSLLLYIAPQIAAGLLIGGLTQHLLSKEKAASLFGRESGLRGLLLATFAGVITPGGPYTSFPLVFAMWTAGADAGAVVAYLVAWALLGLNRIVIWEVPFLGLEFTTLRFLVSLPLPVLAGVVGRMLATRTGLKPANREAAKQ